MINEAFAQRVAAIAHDREALLALMAALDAEKRQIRSFMSKYSNSLPEQGGLAGSERMRKLRRMRDRLSFLTEEREYARQALGRLNGDIKAMNRAINGKGPDFLQAFYAAAERILSTENLEHVEAKAAQMLDAYRTSNP